MKLLTYAEFIALPGPVVYQEFFPTGGSPDPGLMLRTRVLGEGDEGFPRDFTCANLMPMTVYEASPNPGFDLDESPYIHCRWGLYDYTATYLVYEEADLKRLAGWLLDPASYERP